MPTLVFLPYARLAWFASLPNDGQSLADLAQRIEAGDWQLPADWQAWLDHCFVLPDRLALHAQVQGNLLVVEPHPPLAEKHPGAALALSLPLALKPAQLAVLLRLARGQTIHEAARQMQHTPRWVHYQIRGLRKARAALLREERKKRKKKPAPRG